MPKIYLVTAERWDSNENHSYPLGAFSDSSKAQGVAISHTEYRGGKYGCVVHEFDLDAYGPDDEFESKEVFRTTSRLEKNVDEDDEIHPDMPPGFYSYPQY